MIWRFIELKKLDPLMAMAFEEVALEYVQRTNIPIIRFWRWDKKAVSIGRFQVLEDEIDVDKCIENKIIMLRRISGGGAVFNSPGEIVYSVITPYGIMPKDIKKSYEIIFTWIMEGLKSIGINSSIDPPSNIQVNGKKISGNSRLNKVSLSIQHGTILYKIDQNEMFSYLTVNNSGSSGGIKSIYRPVTCIKEHVNISYYDAYNKLKNSFLENKQFEANYWTINEIKKARDLVEKKYIKKDWIFNQ